MDNASIRKNLIWNAFGTTLYFGCQWLVTVMVTKQLGYRDAGILSLAMSLSSMFQPIALFGIRNFQVSDINNEYSDSTYIGFRNLTCLLSVFICTVFALINAYEYDQFIAIVLFMLIRAAESYADVMYGIVQKKDRLDIAGKGFALKGILFLIMFIIGFVLTGSLTFCIMFLAIGSCASLVLFDIRFAKKVSEFKLFEKNDMCISLARKTVPLFICSFLQTMVMAAPRYILEKMTDEISFGAYASIFAPGIIIQAAMGYIYAPFVSKFALCHTEGLNDKFKKLCVKVFAAMTAVGVFIVIAGYLLGDFALTLVFGEMITEYVYLFIPIIIGIFLCAILGFFCTLEVVIRDFKGLIIGCGIGAAADFVVIPLLVHSIGLNGASYGLGISSLLASAFCLFRIILIKNKKLP